MLRRMIRYLVLLGVLTMLVSGVTADIPQVINYQGMLSDSEGVPLDTTLNLNFHIFSDTLGTTLLWSESHVGVVVSGGAFALLLGSSTPLTASVFDGSVLGMAVEIEGGDVTAQLMPIVSMAYSYRTIFADTATYALSSGGGGGSMWSLTGSVLETNDYWAIVRGGASNSLYGDSSRTMVNLGVEATAGASGQNYSYATIGGGRGGVAGHDYATVSGGEGNQATNEHATIGGGRFNVASGTRSTVGGGNGNTASGAASTVCGGGANSAENGDAVVAGGWDNHATGWRSFIAGGSWNKAQANWSSVGGGAYNVASGVSAVVGGGREDTASGPYSVVAGGQTNRATDELASVLGGHDNVASNYAATVIGGEQNSASGAYAIVGGYRNVADGYASNVGGGDLNQTEGSYSAILGGYGDTTVGSYSLAGGYHNIAGANYGTALGGRDNIAEGEYSVASGGTQNVVAGDYATVVGGFADTITAMAHFSYLFGIGSSLTQDSTFMVDMPHFRIGDETGGYELPPTDGTAGHVLATDGSGQVNWTEVSGGGGGYWTLSGSSLQTADYYALSRGGTGSLLYGDSARTMVNWGVGGMTGESGYNYYYATVGGGWSTRARHNFATVAGGDRNDAKGEHSTIGGGRANAIDATAQRATIAGGNGNIAHGSSSFIGGGGANQTFGNDAVVCGGWDNDAYGWRSFLGSGSWNRSEGDMSAVISGQHCAATANNAFVGAGSHDTASGSHSVVAGGYANKAAANRSAILGGDHNQVSGDYSAILGGYGDTITATGDYSYLFGIRSKLTADSTFMVDMPHIRFGDETTGYEFPTADGATSQVLATDGTGHVSWVDPGGGSSSDGGWTDDGSNVRLTTSTDKVGIGTATPSYKLEVVTSGSRAVSGVAAAHAGDAYGVYGEASVDIGSGGAGVCGLNGDSNNEGQLGTAVCGVYGLSHTGSYDVGDYGAGVYGENSNGGYGVHAKSATSFGVYAETDGVSTAAVMGRYNNALCWGHLGSEVGGAFGYYDGNQGMLGTPGYGVRGIGGSDTAVYADAQGAGGVGLLARGGSSGYAAVLEGNLLIRSQSTGLEIVELGEGLDYAEGFDVTPYSDIEPGTVLSIDPMNAGKLTICNEAYDSKVAGIVAGANGLGSGVRLGAGQYDYDVALAGRVYCKVDATYGAIQPGDLLTSSPNPGHAMRASNYDQAHGAILGKAMEPLANGEKGQILVLVTLQ